VAKKFTKDDFDEKTLDEYSEKYSESGLWDKVTGNAKSVGQGLIYTSNILLSVKISICAFRHSPCADSPEKFSGAVKVCSARYGITFIFAFALPIAESVDV